VCGSLKLARKIAKHALTEAARSLGWFVEVRNMLDGKPDGRSTRLGKKTPNFNFNVRFVDPQAASCKLNLRLRRRTLG
jgi:hypothetical protein